MNMQLDGTGGLYLQRKMEQMDELQANLVVVAAGIRPNVELGRKAGLTVNRGIVVNDYMETSSPLAV
jgi:nitrite reductase (NADH) large subunit